MSQEVVRALKMKLKDAMLRSLRSKLQGDKISGVLRSDVGKV